MPFIPHTKQDIQSMLKTIGVNDIDSLFDEIPRDLFCDELRAIPHGLNEQAMTRLIQERAEYTKPGLCFIGAGAYEHHIPAAVWDIVSRGEFLTAYTPYQAEASQGSLQLIYEYQTMMANLLGMEVSNASLYDGASALAEAVLMAARLQRAQKQKKILMPRSVHPHYRETVKTIVTQQHIDLIDIALAEGRIDLNALAAYEDAEITALVIPQPNFFGCLEDINTLTDWAKKCNIVVIACVNPTAMALLKEPGAWGEQGADIVCGEGQPLGVPLASGGPYFGFLACRQAHVRQLPGRLVGRTLDADGKPGFTLTLQAREQHIRRSKATSNICTNQGLLVAAATIYMSLLGSTGLRRVAATSHTQTQTLVQALTAIQGVERAFPESAYFHECVLRLPMPANAMLLQLAQRGIQGGYDLGQHDPTYHDALLVCATETKTIDDIALYASALSDILKKKLMM